MAETLNQTWAAQIIGTLLQNGVRHSVVSPGSRSTPLALACADRADLQVWSILDERSAAFFALGLSKATASPVMLVCTSGTAGAHFLPALMEAAHSAVPIVAITADRPWELQGFGAAQTTDQTHLFGSHVRAFEALSEPRTGALALTHLDRVVERLVARAVSAPAGPVHLNVPFAEPLAPASAAPGPVITSKRSSRGAPHRTPRLDGVAEILERAERGLIVCGPREAADGFGAAVTALGRTLGFPVFAEAASNARYGWPDAVAMYDTFLRAPDIAEALRPDVVLRFGLGLTTKVLSMWLDTASATTMVVSDDGLTFDPSHRAERLVEGSAIEVCRLLDGVQSKSHDYRRRVLALDAALRLNLDRTPDALIEPLIARDTVAALPKGACLMLSSSMPIRDVDSFAPGADAGISVFSNRGLNGIDGVVSTALGLAAGSGRPTLLLTGDVALLHDVNAWVSARRLALSLTVVVVNNDGGGIFHFLPIEGKTRHFEALFGTPHGADLRAVAALGGARHVRATTLEQLRAEIASSCQGGLHLVELSTSRSQNVDDHRRLQSFLVEGLSWP
jgi:2-succinyl-5-enolpyruvyl-6-hydroxy-3-cyclohexene-1-carboxylate synthase